MIPAADLPQGAERALEPVKVLFLGGYSRSGSTLFDRMLGQIGSFASTGELAYVWTHGVVQDRLCGCGLHLSECGFWRAVGEDAFGGWDQVDLAAMLSMHREVNRHRYLAYLLLPWLSPSYARRLRAYAEALGRVYRSIERVGWSRIVVDSTIDPAYGFVLRHVPGIELHVVHFVRDSGGTAFSWTRRVVRTVAGNRMRLQRGAVAVRVDDEWIDRLPRRQQRLVTLLSWPLLRRYGRLESRPAEA